MRLKGKVAIITGAGTGIGEAIAHKFAREGARLLLNGLPADPIGEVAAAITAAGGEVEIYAGDVSEEATARACVDRAIQRFGKLDILVNNAGIFVAIVETQDYRLEDFDRTVRNNVRTAFLMTKFALPHLQQSRGNILCTGSEAGFNGSPGCTPYGGTKGFLHAFVQGLAVEQAHYGVRANCVCPGAIDTAWTRAGLGPMDQAMADSIDEGIPLGRRGTPKKWRTYSPSSPRTRPATLPAPSCWPMAQARRPKATPDRMCPPNCAFLRLGSYPCAIPTMEPRGRSLSPLQVVERSPWRRRPRRRSPVSRHDAACSTPSAVSARAAIVSAFAARRRYWQPSLVRRDEHEGWRWVYVRKQATA